MLTMLFIFCIVWIATHDFEMKLDVSSIQMPDSLWLTIDGEFLPAHPRKLLMTHGFAPVPLMLGFNNTEGHGVLALSYPPPFADGLDDQSGSMMLKSLLEASIPVRFRLAFLSQQCVSVQWMRCLCAISTVHWSLHVWLSRDCLWFSATNAPYFDCS